MNDTPREALLADIAAWTAIAETMRDSPESFSPYAASGVARTFLDLVERLTTPMPAAGAVERAPNDIEWLISEMKDHVEGDHERGCDGRTYACGCGYDNYTAALLNKARAALASVSAPPGFVLVPVEPTEAMIEAGCKACIYDYDTGFERDESMPDIYRAMIAAAVKP